MQTIFTTYTMIRLGSMQYLILQNLKINNNKSFIKKKKIQFLNEIEFKNISFRYENSKNFILKDINIKIKR